MKANELRIGNIVTDEWEDSGTIIKVESINKKGIDLEIEDDGNYPECAQRWIEPCYRFDSLRGIKITEDWLFKFGFSEIEFSDETFGYIKDKFIYVNSGQIGYENKRFLIENEIDNVHQLQNIFFTLTGEELTFETNEK